VLIGNSPGCRATPASRLQNGLTSTKERPASSRAHPAIFLRHGWTARSMTTSGMICGEERSANPGQKPHGALTCAGPAGTDDADAAVLACREDRSRK
jgi:hypothetical protein